MLGGLLNLELTRFLAVEVRPSVRVRLPFFVNWAALQPIDIVESCGDASAAVAVVLSIKLTFLSPFGGEHSHITSATNEGGITQTVAHLHVHLEDAEAVGEGAAAREAARRQRDPPRPPAARALRHERGLPGAHQTSGGRGGSWGER